jgi:S-methyl-5-thioribose-1-phosphate isomerase
MQVNDKHYRTVWMEGAVVKMIDQPLLPHKFEIAQLPDHKATAEAIANMTVRGAGAIGAAASYAMAQAALEAPDDNDGFKTYVALAADTIRNTRPTAQDLFYAIEKVCEAINSAASPAEAKVAAVKTAETLADENVRACEEIGRTGAEFIKDGMRILTHCNAGWLAFVDWGSALAPIYAAKRQGRDVSVFVDETRPRCQGARLTAWELAGEGIDHVVIADNAAGHYMKAGEIDLVIVGSDRIAANGDVANKIGTYEKAVVAGENDIPFYVAAPTSTIDNGCASGDDIPIEERSDDEVLYTRGLDDSGRITRVRTAPEASSGRNPAFDVTPARYVTAIITEKGIFKPGADLGDI